MNAYWVFILAALNMGAVDPPNIIGTVISTQGTWCDEAHQTCGDEAFSGVGKMYPVQRDSRLRRVAPLTGREAIVIRSRWGEKKEFDCSQPRELGCNAPLDLSRLSPPAPRKSVYSAFYDAVTELAATRPRVYDTFGQGILLTRGSDEQPLLDGVVELRPDGLVLDKVINIRGLSEYLVELCPLDDNAQPKCAVPPILLEDTENSQRVFSYPAGTVNAGAYRAYLWDQNAGGPRRTRTYAEWILAEAPRSTELAADFLRVKQATRSWDATDPTAPALRRAYLYSIAQH